MAVEEVARPIPEADEVLVKVEAAGVGPWDILVRSGQSELRQALPLTLGSDLSGTVIEVGSSVATLASGDLVYGSTNAQFTGAYAQFAVAKAAMLAPKPLRSTFIEAAGVPVIAVTAWRMLFDLAKVMPHQKVLVTGAAGSVGGYVLQFTRWHRVGAVAVISSDDDLRVRSLGAEEVIDLRQHSLESLRARIDVVIDTAGGDKQREAALTLKPGGTLVSCVSPPDPLLMSQLRIRGEFFIVDLTTSHLDRIARMIDEGTIVAHVGTVLALEEARIAHEMMAGERPYPRGKIVLNINRNLP